MRLIDLNPGFISAGPSPEQRDGIGIIFDCPCGCDVLCAVYFRNPVDGGGPYPSERGPLWCRTGDTFEALTLTPSIHRSGPGGCGWHGWIKDGEVLTA